MGKKYIIELEDNESVYKTVYNTIIADEHPILQVIAPAPYTEPDLEHVRKEAFEKGYSTAVAEQECAVRGAAEKGYQKGLSDAWDAARKICTNWVLSDSVLSEIFGMDKTIDDVMKENTASEAIEKIRAYEQKEEIQVGDEVNAPFGKAIVVNIDSVAEKIWLVYADGHGGFEYFKDAPTKTGRHFPEIAEVFAKMKETDNG